MKLFSMFTKGKDIPEEGFPWHNLFTIFRHIVEHLDEEGKLTKAGITLPDEERRYKDVDIRWVSGALDGAYGHHFGGGSHEEEAQKASDLIVSIARNNADSEKVELYSLLTKDNLIDFVDTALEKIVATGVATYPYLHLYARWLAFESPDRGPVKFGIALLGVIRDATDIENIVILGKHEEFTLYSAVAITNILEDSEQELWSLAKKVDGWGKIHIVERLAETQNAEIKKWLIRDGYKNGVMYEYLAYTCAVTGDLKTELSQPIIDNATLEASGDIIAALIAGGPAQDMDDYEDGPDVVQLYLMHIANEATELRHYLILHDIQEFLRDEEADWSARHAKGWTEDVNSNILIDLHRLLNSPHWKRLVLANLNTTDDMKFWRVNQVANRLGIDIWETHWKRLTDRPSDSGRWYDVMQNANHVRIDHIVAYACQILPLAEIATGPADNLGLGKEYEPHSCLSFILQDLGDYPQHGFSLIKTGLQSSVTSSRNYAIRALSAWGKEHWPQETKKLLEQAEKAEPNTKTKMNLKKLLEGQIIE